MHVREKKKLIECLGLTYVVARNLILHCYWNIRFFFIYFILCFFRIETMKSEYHLISVYGFDPIATHLSVDINDFFLLVSKTFKF